MGAFPTNNKKNKLQKENLMNTINRRKYADIRSKFYQSSKSKPFLFSAELERECIDLFYQKYINSSEAPSPD
jgi:hypothetical protein